MNYKFTAVFVFCVLEGFQRITSLLQCLFCVLEGSSEFLVLCSVCFVPIWKVPVNFWFTAVFVLCPGRFQ